MKKLNPYCIFLIIAAVGIAGLIIPAFISSSSIYTPFFSFVYPLLLLILLVGALLFMFYFFKKSKEFELQKTKSNLLREKQQKEHLRYMESIKERSQLEEKELQRLKEERFLKILELSKEKETITKPAEKGESGVKIEKEFVNPETFKEIIEEYKTHIEKKKNSLNQ